ncbi:MAG: hypothetical protein NTY20_04250 [Candidatus Aenigmarchaeota archaeon]|nr:hypothetical protein [Candidatus Aenigmarchaeota archaeon]
MDEKHKRMKHMDMRGFGWRVALSILVSMGWLAFLIIWLFFYAGSFSIYQNIAILIVSILVVGAIMGASWASWGMRHGHGWERCAEEEKAKGRRNQRPKATESPSNENPPSGHEKKPAAKKRNRKRKR